MAQPRQAGETKAARTRAAILAEAETLFAERGFEGTRLEDVAEAVGIRRASIVYHFRDKRALYDAVLGSLLGDFRERVRVELSRPEPLAERVEAAVSAWVDYVGGRPSLARILLREVADAAPGRRPALLKHVEPFFALIREQVYERAGEERTPLAPVDPVHLASTIAGATIFFVAAMPVLVPELRLDPTSPARLETHRQELLRIVRRLLGTRGPRPARRPPARGKP